MSGDASNLRLDQGGPQCDHCGGAPSIAHGDEMRCGCGNLLARAVAGGVEVKCRRCKRTVLLAVEEEVPSRRR